MLKNQIQINQLLNMSHVPIRHLSFRQDARIMPILQPGFTLPSFRYVHILIELVNGYSTTWQPYLNFSVNAVSSFHPLSSTLPWKKEVNTCLYITKVIITLWFIGIRNTIIWVSIQEKTGTDMKYLAVS